MALQAACNQKQTGKHRCRPFNQAVITEQAPGPGAPQQPHSPRGAPRGAAVSLKGDIIIICDHENCPASATHLIFTPAGEIVLCSHHFNEVIADVLILGYEVHARVLEGV